jgi:hypothetical protein
MTSRVPILVLVLMLLPCCGCGPGDSAEVAPPAPPAKVAKPADESELAIVTLTPKAEERLGIRIAQVQRKPIRQRRTLGGEVTFPPGKAITVSAPLSGTLAAIAGGDLPPPGSQVEKGQPIFSLLPLLPPEHSVLTPAEQAQLAESRAARLWRSVAQSVGSGRIASSFRLAGEESAEDRRHFRATARSASDWVTIAVCAEETRGREKPFESQNAIQEASGVAQRNPTASLG